jgi:hypothetical protein
MYLRLVQVLALMLLINSCSTEAGNSLRQKISLEGEWNFALDSLQAGINERWFEKTLPEVVSLPGTLDENGKGVPNTNTQETMRLSRERIFEGWSWYRRDIIIPAEWKSKNIRLILERTKPSTLWIDTIMAGTNNSILTPQIYDLTELLTPGRHTVTLLINNGPGSVPDGITGSHAWTEHTQTNWNGILGEFYLEAINPDHIESVKVYHDSSLKGILVKTRIYSAGNDDKKAVIDLKADSWNTLKKHNVRQRSYHVVLKPGMNELEINYRLGNRTLLWSEFNPALYRLSLELSGKELADTASVSFGMREFTTKGTRFTVNGAVTFLRGKHDACVFPLTGHPPMDVESWRKVFRIAKSYHMNFYRFHSWTPPEAAFEAADMEGIYLQPELPFWGSFSKTSNADMNEFLLRTGENILDIYGNHASFVMFALGNELSGDQEVMNDFLRHFKSMDNRPLMAYGSNNYLGYHGQAEGEDYYAGCRIGPDTDTTYHTHIRASFSFADAYDGGYINGRYPSTILNYSGAISKCSVPAISTEVGQYQVYPNYDEIKKYTGVLKPWNFLVFQKRLEEKNLGDQALDFFRASGALSVICYRADIEMALRTPGFGGFHLLDLQDFPGQGTALVGILDAFMDSKGLITPGEFSHFCNKVVPLFITEKFCWTNDEKLKGNISVANYSEKEIRNQKVSWDLRNSNNEIVEQGGSTVTLKQGELTGIPGLVIDLSRFNLPEKTTLNIILDGTEYENSYSLWIYPDIGEIKVPECITIAEKLDSHTVIKLASGGKVLLFPDHNDIIDQSVGGLFITDYWNYRMFKGISESNRKPVSPGTMGILTNPEHPVFDNFPTEFHSNWQWWPIVKKSRPFILDNAPENYRPIVQVVDNIERNHKLGLIFEFTIGRGKLLVCMSNLKAIQDKPEARQLYSSIFKYMASEKFNPGVKITPSELIDLFSSSVTSRKITGVRNISYTKD